MDAPNVSHLSGLEASLDALVHESARGCLIERARHLAFIRLRLSMSLAAAIFAPLLLALGAPPLWQALAFAFAMLPLLAVALVSRRGAIVEGHMICVAGLAGLALTAALGVGMGMAASLWLLLMPFEASLARASRRIAWATLAAALLGGCLLLAGAGGFLPTAGQDPIADMLLGIGALAYGLGLAQSWRAEVTIRAQTMNDERARTRVLCALVSDVEVHFHRSGAVVFVGEACEPALGLRASALSGRGFCERVQVADRPVFLKAIADAAAGKGSALACLRLHTSDIESARGQFCEPVFRHVELRATAFAGADGTAVMALLRDVSDVVAAGQIVEERHVAALEDQHWKDRLLANVSHELRTPLNAIIGFSEMLGSQHGARHGDAQRREYADIINASGQHLLSVVNSILDMSKIEAGSFQILAEPFDLPPLIESCCDILRLKAQQGEVAIARDFKSGLAELVADKRACRQILLNLLSNAIKFTPAGGSITVGARAEGTHLAIYVADTGIGIGQSDLPRLGDPFFQAQATLDRRHEGTGLGLSVVKGLVGLHGGTISLESAPGQGTCVTVRLPLDCRGAKIAPQVATIQTLSRRAAAPVHDVTMVKKIA